MSLKATPEFSDCQKKDAFGFADIFRNRFESTQEPGRSIDPHSQTLLFSSNLNLFFVAERKTHRPTKYFGGSQVTIWRSKKLKTKRCLSEFVKGRWSMCRKATVRWSRVGAQFLSLFFWRPWSRDRPSRVHSPSGCPLRIRSRLHLAVEALFGALRTLFRSAKPYHCFFFELPRNSSTI